VRGTAYRDLRDGQLVELVAQKDAGALEALYDRYGRAAYSLARRILAGEALAQDVVQEVFLSLWRDAARFDAGRGDGRHLPAVDGPPPRRRRGAAGGEPAPLADLGGGAGARAGPRAGVEDEVETGERRAEVRAALKELPDGQREALLLAYFGGYTQREVAALVGVPLGTVKTRMAAGMRELKAALQDAGSEEHPWTRQ
jgi:DNA-directed RNA polymerase specialized sigma24 family protein